MFEKKFLEATAERAIKTFLQTFLALLGTDAAGVLTVEFLPAAQVAGSAALLSVLTSFASSKVGNEGPSLAGETTASSLKALAEKVVPVIAAEAIKTVENSTKEPAKKPAPAKKKPAAKKKTS